MAVVVLLRTAGGSSPLDPFPVAARLLTPCWALIPLPSLSAWPRTARPLVSARTRRWPFVIGEDTGLPPGPLWLTVSRWAMLRVMGIGAPLMLWARTGATAMLYPVCSTDIAVVLAWCETACRSPMVESSTYDPIWPHATPCRCHALLLVSWDRCTEGLPISPRSELMYIPTLHWYTMLGEMRPQVTARITIINAPDVDIGCSGGC